MQQATDPALWPRQPNALLAFQTGCDEVADAAWCPSNATAFAAVTAGGRVEVCFSHAAVLMGCFLALCGGGNFFIHMVC